MKKPARAALPTDKVRFVGDPIACVVAETVLQAKDAAEAIELDIEPLPAVTDFAQGRQPRRAGDLRRCAGQRRARLSTTATADKVERALSPRAALQGQAEDVNTRRCGQRDGAARRDRRIRQGQGQLHAACRSARA